jgi:hypothetical protein
MENSGECKDLDFNFTKPDVTSSATASTLNIEFKKPVILEFKRPSTFDFDFTKPHVASSATASIPNIEFKKPSTMFDVDFTKPNISSSALASNPNSLSLGLKPQLYIRVQETQHI